MSSDKPESLVQIWAERYDDRDAEDLLCRKWADGLTIREQAMANPIKNFVATEEFPAGEAVNDPATTR